MGVQVLRFDLGRAHLEVLIILLFNYGGCTIYVYNLFVHIII